MDSLKGMAIFATVVDKGSMAAAAESLGLTPSAVSQQIRRLESRAQVTLLHRTTRRLTLTEAGEAFYRSCAQMLAIAEEAERRLGEWRDAPVGELRLAAPVGLSGSLITQALKPLLEDHRQLRLQLFFQDERIDLVAERIDLAIRVGNLADSSLVARHLGDWNHILCAAPGYLRQRAPLKRPEQLLELDWIALNTASQFNLLTLTGADGEVCKLRLEPRVAANGMLAVRQFTLDGLGVSCQPLPEVREALDAGRLQRLLPEWKLPDLGIHAVTPRRDAQPAKVKVAIEALRRAFATG
ncbi:TPA: LysR family transcriptional regulator [Pseudomonas aeruginosa]|uniref:Putative transcriptional regulator n=1 Tax=Pseudomonas paraeruginosa (strain DSM 24068 / PA7) TaxID=381754 RepID=A6UXQ9_PSEP7|nr:MULTISPECIES: LysR family transcriptional regulator [Pseudomonas aeruginosa group]ABR83352.1 putative transcriptional regulator [Pseudomonas aeruginosa PA7]KSC87052.1 LysR family transcriptional regulator [Pseudomonas aeruginosa]KSD18692.1 LysR family transcriptional regulator [Pseudomonas aeruginosa]KSG47568.1 LysR family transcriptional regulator [Pseudomonas aeruginosa]MCW8360290.1 LysR family transcriptional regulator [Pseudomonas aeruginosa]